MIKKTCPNGHVYDQSIYGDTCPLCPSTANVGASNPASMTIAAPDSTSGAHTRVVQPPVNPQPAQQGIHRVQQPLDPTGKTMVSPEINRQNAQTTTPQGNNIGNKTTIRRNPAMMSAPVKPGEDGRKLVGFLVTYNRTPMGKAFNIYEGRNYVGRDSSCDIPIPDDNQMSGKHLLIRYLSGNNKFSFKDEMSSNGTYVNKELIDEGELHNYDIIRVGSTLFIFIAIPQI